MEDRLLTPAQCAEVANVHKSSIYRWIDDGELNAQVFGKKTILVKESDLSHFLDGRKNNIVTKKSQPVIG